MLAFEAACVGTANLPSLPHLSHLRLSISSLCRLCLMSPAKLAAVSPDTRLRLSLLVQYAIYLAQALQANGRKKEAVGLLKRCGGHPDTDVRKIADGVLYVMQAPELKLDSNMFVTIPKLEEVDDWGSRRRSVEEKDPPPEKYSLEWYVEEAEKKKASRAKAPEPADPTAALVAGAALIGLALVLK